MDLKSGRVISRRKVTEIPVNDLVIEAVEKMATNDGLGSLKFETKAGVTLHDNDWIAGVDYNITNNVNTNNDADEDDEDYQDEDGGIK